MVGLTQVLFPIVVLLGLNGLLVGILNAYDHFTIPALAPLVWNFVIIGVLVVAAAAVRGRRRDVRVRDRRAGGTVVQLAMACRSCGARLRARGSRFDFRDPRVRQVLALMLPMTIGLGLINFNLFINSVLGSTVSEEAPRAIDAAFRIYMLPAGDVQRRGRDGAVPGAAGWPRGATSTACAR